MAVLFEDKGENADIRWGFCGRKDRFKWPLVVLSEDEGEDAGDRRGFCGRKDRFRRLLAVSFEDEGENADSHWGLGGRKDRFKWLRVSFEGKRGQVTVEAFPLKNRFLITIC